MKLPNSLYRRVLVLVLGLVAAIWLGAALVTYFDARHELDELLDGHLAQAALLVAQQTHDLDDNDDVRAEAPLSHRYASKVAFQVWHEGRLLQRSANAPAQPLGDARTGFATVTVDGTAWRVFAERGHEDDVQVYVGEQVDSRTEILHSVTRGLLWPLAIALPALALAGWWAVRRGLRPLGRLGAALAARGADALDPVEVADAPVEMHALIAALNGLFARIAALLETERRFTADAAHELRTPIAAIRAQAQVALGAAHDAERRRALAATLAGCDRAAHLVEQLLTLARLENAAAPAPARIDLAALARSVAAELAGHALARRQTLELEAEQPCPVTGEPTLLGALIRNLIDNAIRYSPDAARIQVSVAAHDGQVVLAVEDSGPGMTGEQRRRLGERFYRVLGTDQSGSGLGWSIVRRIAAAHGARVQVDASPALRGLRVRVELPRAR